MNTQPDPDDIAARNLIAEELADRITAAIARINRQLDEIDKLREARRLLEQIR